MPVSAAAARLARIAAHASAVVALALTIGSCASGRPAARAPGPSSAAPPATSSATAPGAIIAVPTPGAPAPPAAATAPIAPPTEVPAPTGVPPPPGPAPVSAGGPPGPNATIALILPLDAKPFTRAAEAVRAGFLAAAGAAGDQSNCIVIAHGEDGVLAAFEDARARGVKIIIGPLLRDDLKAVAQLALDLPFTVALNQLDEGTPSSPHLYTFSLAIESDARLIARRIRADGIPSVAVVGAETPLMKRFASAFATEWLAEGGPMPDAYRFEGTPEGLTAMRRDLARRKTTNAVLLAVDSASATLAKPYLGTIPAYASGLVFERETDAVTRDLDGLVLVEIPWIIAPDAFADLPKQEFTSTALARLYALGLDAYRVARAFRDGPPERFTLEGATGKVTLVDGRQFAREGRFAVFRAGQLTPLDVPH